MSKFITLLGFAQKAGKIITGDDTCEMFLKKRRVKLLIIAGDASENTKDKFRFLASKNQVPLIEISTKDDLSQAIGKSNRAVIGILDNNFAKTLLAAVESSGQ